MYGSKPHDWSQYSVSEIWKAFPGKTGEIDEIPTQEVELDHIWDEAIISYSRIFKIQNDIRKTSDTLKDILNKKISHLSYPPFFIHNDERITEATDIADNITMTS